MKGRSKKKKVELQQDLKDALIKKALGSDVKEIVEEYSSDSDGEVKLSKKKVTTKNVPPDMTALKILLDENQKDTTQMTDEELYSEKIRLLCLLKQIQEN